MTKFQRAPQSEVQSSEWRTPAEVVFKRRGGVSGGSPARRSVLPISNGFRVEQSKRGVSSVRCVGRVRCVGSASVSGLVVYRLRPVASVASAYGSSPEDPQAIEGVKGMFLRMLRQSRRATAANQFERMQQRLAGQAEHEVQRQLCVGSVGSVAFSQFNSRPSVSGCVALRSGQSSFSQRRSRQSSSNQRPVQSDSCVRGVPVEFVSVASRVQSEIAESVSEMSKVASVAFRASAQSAGRPVASSELVQSRQSFSRERAVASASVAPVGSVQSSAGEWRQVGDALSSVLGRVRAVVEASAQMETAERDGKGRMH